MPVPSLTPNIENRVRKLPKPSNATQGLQPLFEAVSNAVYALEDEFPDDAKRGRVTIEVKSLSKPSLIEIVVSDNGIGLDAARYEAFCEIDTDFKRAKGGKGVGRLFWLDAFQRIKVESIYRDDNALEQRRFAFVLSNDEQIVPEPNDGPLPAAARTGTTVRFQGLRTKEYADHFPSRSDTFLRYFSSHFIADFLLGVGPSVVVSLDGDITQYPDAVAELTVGRPLESGVFTHKDYGELSITGFTCLAEASTGLDGNHQLHLLGNGRTVESRKVDNLLGLRSIERDGETGLYFHGCVSGPYLDARVNEGRTAFTLSEKILKDISRICIAVVRERLLPDQIQRYVATRRQHYEKFVERYPTYGFDNDETQLGRVPFHATASEEFAAGLVKYQIRQEESRQEALQTVIDALNLETVPLDIDLTVAKAARDIQASEQLALAQHVVRRKLALELMEKLITRIRLRHGKEDDHHLERTLHSFICPMGVRGDDPYELKSRAHDLWIVDERLAFTRAFASDKRLDGILAKGGSADRPDLFIWNLAYCTSSEVLRQPGCGFSGGLASSGVDI
jgi:hypothetical protein